MIIQSPELVNHPVVSVVIPSYNRADVVGQTIDSILGQQCNFEFEIVIGDDCSTDNVREVLKDYQQRFPAIIKLLFHNTNLGLGANWATCVQHCRGKYVANCDNDDFWHNPEKLQLQVDYMEQHQEIGVCHTYYRKLNRKKNQYKELLSNNNENLTEPLYLAILHLNGFECCNASILYRKEVLDQYINLDDYIKHRFTLQDWNTWVVLGYYSKFYCLPVCTTTMCIDNDSITRNSNFDVLLKRMDKEEETYNYITSKFPDIPNDPTEYKVYKYNVFMNWSFNQLDFKKARKFATELKQLGDRSVKIYISNSILLFYAFCFGKKAKLYFSKIFNT
jgi:glycosyltransferase involved in cell wall biosynthesis